MQDVNLISYTKKSCIRLAYKNYVRLLPQKKKKKELCKAEMWTPQILSPYTCHKKLIKKKKTKQNKIENCNKL